MNEPVGLIGVGLLGTALAERFLAAGYLVCGFDLDAQRHAALGAIGGQAAPSAAEVAARCPRVVLCLPNSNVVASVVAEILPSLASGSLLIDVTTGDPDRTAQLGEDLSRRNVGYLDATIAGSSQQARRGEVIVMAGGRSADLEKCNDLLASFSKQVFHVGPWGSGARMKLVVNLVLGLNRAVLAEGLCLARAAGLNVAAALNVLKASPAFSTVMETKGAKMLSGDYSPEARLAQHRKDVRLILELGERSQAGLPLSTLHETLLQRAIELGYAEADNSAVLKAIEEWPARHSTK